MSITYEDMWYKLHVIVQLSLNPNVGLSKKLYSFVFNGLRTIGDSLLGKVYISLFVKKFVLL
jgi:thiamine transporter ThiT